VCDTLLNCLLINFKLGFSITNGGMLVKLKELTPLEPTYYDRYFFDLFYLILCLIIIMGILLGVVIDTVIDVIKSSKTISLNKNKCSICGIDIINFNSLVEWESHINAEHNIISYVYFIIGLENKSPDHCDDLEKIIKNYINNNDSSFLPKDNTITI